jgi:hypothetical protein
MYDPTNPYASPMSTEMNPVAVQWLGTPSPSLLKVARGLGLIYSGICLALLSAIGGTILVAVVAAATRSAELVGLLGVLMGIGIVVAGIMNIVGTLMCTATPEESGAKGMIYASVAAMALAVLISIGIAVGLASKQVAVVEYLANIISGITFLVFMKRLAMFIGRIDLAAKAQSILNWCIGLFVAMIAVMVFTVSTVGVAFFRAAAGGQDARLGDAAAGAGLGFIMMAVIAIAALITFIRYANLLTYLRKAILSGGQG